MTARGGKRLALLSAVALLCWIIAGIIDAGHAREPYPASQAPMTISDGHAVGHRRTERSWSIVYEHLEESGDGIFIEAEGIKRATLYRKGMAMLTLQADRATVNLATDDIALVGHIVGTGRIGAVPLLLRGDRASWRERTEQLVLSGRFLLISQRRRLTVEECILDLRHQRIRTSAISGSASMSAKTREITWSTSSRASAT